MFLQLFLKFEQKCASFTIFYRMVSRPYNMLYKYCSLGMTVPHCLGTYVFRPMQSMNIILVCLRIKSCSSNSVCEFRKKSQWRYERPTRTIKQAINMWIATILQRACCHSFHRILRARSSLDSIAYPLFYNSKMLTHDLFCILIFDRTPFISLCCLWKCGRAACWKFNSWINKNCSRFLVMLRNLPLF